MWVKRVKNLWDDDEIGAFSFLGGKYFSFCDFHLSSFARTCAVAVCAEMGKLLLGQGDVSGANRVIGRKKEYDFASSSS